MALDFKGTVRRSYRLPTGRVLLLHENHEGEIDQGEWLEVELASGTAARAQVISIAWGSGFQATDPPLTLVLSKFEGEVADGEATVRGVEPPDEG